MKKTIQQILSIMIIITAVVLSGCTGTQDEDYSRDSDDFEVRMIYAVKDGMETKYKSQDPIVTCKEYITCGPQSQYDYIMNGKISLLNEYGSRIIYDYSAYIISQDGQYYVVDSIIV